MAQIQSKHRPTARREHACSATMNLHRDPRSRWAGLASSLDSLGIPSVDPAVLSVSHATGATARPTFAEQDTSGGVTLGSEPIGSEVSLDLRGDQEKAVLEFLTMLTALEAGGAMGMSGWVSFGTHRVGDHAARAHLEHCDNFAFTERGFGVLEIFGE